MSSGVAAATAAAGGAAGSYFSRGLKSASAAVSKVRQEPEVATVEIGSAQRTMDRFSAVTGKPAPAMAAAAQREQLDDVGTEFEAADDEAEAPGNSTLADIAGHLMSRAEAGVGYRTMVVGESDRVDPTEEAIELVKRIAQSGHQVVLLDCGLDGVGWSSELGFEGQPGLRELLTGEAGFEDVVKNLPNSVVHFIPCGGALQDDEAIDADGTNLVLDALDEAYDHIVVFGPHDDARTLFEAIQGRFDAGVTICDERRRVSVLDDEDNSFLGFEVTEIDVVRYERTARSAFAMRRLELSGHGADATP